MAMSVFLVFLVTLLCLPPLVSSQPESTLTADRLTGKLWRVIEVTRTHTPQLQVHAILEAPDRDRLTLTFRTESNQTLVVDDVLEFILKIQPSGAIPYERWEDYLTSHRVKLGKTRWWNERLKHEGEVLKKELQRLLERQKKDREI